MNSYIAAVLLTFLMYLPRNVAIMKVAHWCGLVWNS